MSTTEAENKELVQRAIRELVNGKNYDMADELFTADYTRHDADTPGDERGAEPFIEELKRLQEAFPDSEVHVGEIIVEDHLVAFQGTLTGTHEGDFRGIEPTNTEIELPGNARHRVRDGQITETWATWNYLGALEQLGVVEPLGE